MKTTLSLNQVKDKINSLKGRNISLKVNGINQKLTTSESGSSSPMATYAQVISGEIDYQYTGYQFRTVHFQVLQQYTAWNPLWIHSLP